MILRGTVRATAQICSDSAHQPTVGLFLTCMCLFIMPHVKCAHPCTFEELCKGKHGNTVFPVGVARCTPAVGRLGEPRSPPFVPQDRSICARHFISGPFILFHLLAVDLRIGIGCRPLEDPASSADAKPDQHSSRQTPLNQNI